MESGTGVEQRAALLTWPRKTLTYQVINLSAAQSAYVKRKLYKNLYKVFGVPIWMDRTELSSQASSGQKILNVTSTEKRNFEVGAPCLIYTNESTYEYGEIDSFTSNQITLVGNLTYTWDADTDVYPLLQGRLQQTQDLMNLTSAYSKFTVTVVEV
ncbi:unnamed protein product, partial [marine sediment metagenome]